MADENFTKKSRKRHFSEETRRKMSETAKKNYSKGKSPLQKLSKDQIKKRTLHRIKTLKENYTEEEISSLMSEISLKQSKSCRSKAASKANFTRLRRGNHNFQNLTKEELSERNKRTYKTRVLKHNISYIISKIELNCYNFLKENLDEKLVSQYFIEGLNHPYDMYSPKYNLIIEFDGDYYHRNKESIDKRYSEIAINNGYKIFRIKENCYNKDKIKVLNEIKTYLRGE